MRVLSVAFPEMAVGTAEAGGAEQILSILERGLVERGIESTVVAAKGSKVAGDLIETRDPGDAIESALADNFIDLIHFHGLDFHRFLPRREIPMLATLHLPVAYYPAWLFDGSAPPCLTLNCVSKNQAASTELSAGLAVIPNGVPRERYLPSRSCDSLLWLGRICPEKGVHIALEVAHTLDARLIVAGPVHSYPEHRAYFEQRVAPLLDAKRTYEGAVEGERKSSLLSRAKCLLIPSLVAETSSLVAMEALSSGTPVVAFRNGALPEIVKHGKTGFIVDSPAEMAEAVSHIPRISRALCREEALARFDPQRMIGDYLGLYRAMLHRATATRHFGILRAPHQNL